MVTNPRAFPTPLTTQGAIDQVDEWLRLPIITVVAEAEDHRSILRGLLLEAGSAGNLTSDAHLAAIAISYGATLVSCDADFGRFRRLRLENPASRV